MLYLFEWDLKLDSTTAEEGGESEGLEYSKEEGDEEPGGEASSTMFLFKELPVI